MGKFYPKIEEAHRAFVDKQHLFFVATAPSSTEGHVNLSPKGVDSFRILSDTEVGYMDLIGSGNETSAHTLENGRITFMFCSFDKVPNILRFYGRGKVVLPHTPEWEKYAPQFTTYSSTRQLIIAEINLVQTSCGFGIPLFDYVGERSIHFDWAEKKGEEGLRDYVGEKNLISLDGLPTHWEQELGK
ncbi:pyridoxamine 5'-phosphate oxidase family protein [Runella limosa]|uniref:pyridoxamine 5'-phosphate oxidase family protein n=1 Tax=Runella limosa TaxID=370978 RepID=UPI00042113F5|nr:pyridoxamine 5'-phosphate oxidase family protein [Runella limosa]